MVTHDIPEGISMADRMLILSRRPATLAADFPLDFPEAAEALTPLARRNHPNFSTYFNLIWKELDVHE